MSVLAEDSLISTLNATKYATVASATALAWDILVTSDIEVEVMWKSPRSYGKTVFFLNRYLPLCSFAVDLYSQFVWSPTENVVSILFPAFSNSIVQYILAMRIHALYRSKKMLVFVSVFCMMSTCSVAGFGLLIQHWENYLPSPIPGVSGCIPLPNASNTKQIITGLASITWFLAALSELVLFALTAWKLYCLSSRFFGRTQIHSRITELMLRDGAMYFIVMFCTALFSAIVGLINPASLSVTISFMKFFQATSCSRVMLNLKQINYTPILSLGQNRDVERPDFPRQAQAIYMERQVEHDASYRKPPNVPTFLQSDHALS